MNILHHAIRSLANGDDRLQGLQGHLQPTLFPDWMAEDGMGFTSTLYALVNDD